MLPAGTSCGLLLAAVGSFDLAQVRRVGDRRLSAGKGAWHQSDGTAWMAARRPALYTSDGYSPAGGGLTVQSEQESFDLEINSFKLLPNVGHARGFHVEPINREDAVFCGCAKGQVRARPVSGVESGGGGGLM